MENKVEDKKKKMKLTINQKMERVKAFLTENGISYEENHMSQRLGIVVPLYIRKYSIAIYPGENNEFYNSVKYVYAPLFVREEETMAFILEKLQNLIIKRMSDYHKRELRKQSKSESK